MKKLLILLCLLGCSPNRPLSPVDPPNGKVITEMENGKTISIKAGDILVFSLKVNANADYFWEIDNLGHPYDVVDSDQFGVSNSFSVRFTDSDVISFTFYKFTDTGLVKLKNVRYTIKVEKP